MIAETARGSASPSMHQQQENLRSLIEDIERVTKMLHRTLGRPGGSHRLAIVVDSTRGEEILCQSIQVFS
jgi:hypothetical protein